MKIAIYGPGGFGRELVRPALEMVADISGSEPDMVIFVSDDPLQVDTVVCGIRVVSPDKVDCPVVIAIADASVRRRIAESVQAGNLFAGTSRIGSNVTIGEGAIFCDYTVVTASAKIGRHFHCNIYSYVAHDCIIGDFVTFAPKVCCNGNVHIEDDVYIGTGAIIKQGTPDKPLRIGRGSVVGMGAVVTKDVEPGAVVIGNPARPR